MLESICADEVWLPAFGWEGYYEVSSQGRVRSVDRIVVTPRGKWHYKQRIMSFTVHVKSGHVRVELCRNGKSTSVLVNRLVLSTFVGPPPDGEESCHENGDPADNRAANLYWGTRSNNMRDKVRHGGHHNAIKRCCRWGHVYAPPNLRKNKSQRRCLACLRAGARARRARVAGRPYDMAALRAECYKQIMAAA
jgi:hypothetical protein